MNQRLKSHLRPSINGSIRKQGLCPASIKQGAEIAVTCKHRERSEQGTQTGDSLGDGGEWLWRQAHRIAQHRED
jgi:hypothetical protein